MNANITSIIQTFSAKNISAERKKVLAGLIIYIQDKKSNDENIRLNFICTHNSRRSHLSQIWAQTMAFHFSVKNVFCYSGGTEATAMFPKVAETLALQGFDILKLSDTTNPVYAVKYMPNEQPIICFSKEYYHTFNPSGNYGAVVTCNSADEACPIVIGAEARIPIKYDDPKAFDHTDIMDAKYAERSLQIAEEMWFVFGQINNL
ncbi:MAG: protein-tyrosine-phosphatase [Saprospiraceae bacterium]|nr:protein-tyrosine-phosphatase [Saprospiraceae bacterium]